MKLSCKNCNINHCINKIKDELEYIIIHQNQNLIDDKVVTLSQLLDNFIYKCEFCNKNILCLSSLNSNNEYFRDTNFLISLYFYMIQAIKKNQFIYLSMDENLYDDLLNILRSNSFPTESIKFNSIKEIIISNKNGGQTEMEENIKDIFSKDQLKKYSGLRWISQPIYAVKNTSLKDFFDWEMNLSDTLRNVNPNSSLQFVHKKYNHMDPDKYINEPIIDMSLNVDSYVLDDKLFKGLEYKFENSG
jgi:hypothetical protein